MPCVAVSNNRARKASIKAAKTAAKDNRRTIHAAKSQQAAAARTQAATAKAQAKLAKSQAKTSARLTKRTAKARQTLEKRVMKKYQAHRAKSKAAQAAAAKVQARTAKVQLRAAAKAAKSQARAAKAQAKTAAKAAISQAKAAKSQAKTAARAKKLDQLKTSLKQAKLPSATSLKTTLKKSLKPLKKSLKRPATTSPKSGQPATSRAAKLSGAGREVAFKITHNTPPAAPIAPLRRTAFMTRGDLINAESRLGSTIFGPIPAGHRREFFHDQENIWIWFESWHDEIGHPHQLTVRYEVRPTGVYKKISAGAYFKLAGDELENFRRATHAYLGIVKKYLYPHVATK